MSFTAVSLSVYTFFAALTDIRQNKIYNSYALAGFFAGLILRTLTGGLAGMGQALLGALLAAAALIPVYLLRAIGGGDVKLLVAVAVFLPVKQMLFVLGASFVLAAGIGSVLFLASRGTVRRIRFAVPVFLGVMLLTVLTGG